VATCPVTPLKGTFFLFQKGSFLDIQFNKNPDLHKNPILTQTIEKLKLNSLNPQGFPYTGASSSNWLFVFDLGCNPPGPLTLTLTNKEGKKISVSLELFKGTCYTAVLRGIDSKTLAEFFAKGTQSVLSLVDGSNKSLWQSGSLQTFRPSRGSPESGSPSGGDKPNSGTVGKVRGGGEDPPPPPGHSNGGPD
jgi:hypothetical protein